MKWMMRIFWAILLTAVLVGGYLAFAPQPIEVEVARVQRGRVEVTIDEDGKTRIKDKYVVSTPVAGRLQRIQLQAGDAVQANQTVLAEILPANPEMLDARSVVRARAQVAAAKAAIERAQARVRQLEIEEAQARREYDRAPRLVETDAISSSQFERMQTEYRGKTEALRSAKFDQKIATFELQLAEAALMHFEPDATEPDATEPDATEPDATEQENKQQGFYFEIKSPINGVVLRLLQESSTVVAPGTPLMEIGDPGDLEVVVDVLTTDAVQLNAGTPVYLEQWGGGDSFPGVVRLIEPAAFEKVSALGVEEQRVNVIIDFLKADQRAGGSPASETSPTSQQTVRAGPHRLGDGYRVDARMVVWSGENVLRVPTSALFRHQSDWAVFAVIENRIQLRRVNVGHRNDQVAEVLSGLEESERVVLHPSDQLSDGALVTFDKS